MKSIISWFTDNHVAANLLMLFMLLGGAVTAMTMKVEVFPETALDIIAIDVAYPGASPAEVEEAVIRHIEEKVAGLAGIKRINSTSREGFGSISIEVMKDWRTKKLLDEVKAEVDRITTLPDEAEKAVVREISRRSRVIKVAVYGDASEATIKYLSEKIKDDITNLPGVTQAVLQAVRKPEIHIEISETTLRRYGLTLDQVAGAVRRESLDLPAGSVKTASGEILIRTKGRRYHADGYRDVAVITRPDGSQVTLGQIAALRDGYQDIDLYARFQGKPAGLIQVYRVADQNALEVAKKVKAYLEKTRPSLPRGLQVAYYSDRTEILKSRMTLLFRNLGIGLLLVSMLLWMFLDLRLAFWVSLGIPVSFLSGLMFLPRFDVSINMISLFAFILVLGIVVDDAIIVGENIYRRQTEGLLPFNAAVEGAVEVGRPVIFSVLTTVVAFWPLLMAGGTMGKLMRNLPVVVNLVLLGSLVESLLILPSHLSGGRRGKHKKPLQHMRQKVMSRALAWVIRKPYARLIDLCLNWRYAAVAIGIAMLLLSYGVFKAGWVRFTFFPKVEGNTMRCYITMPTGTPVKRTEDVVRRVEKAALKVIAEAEKKRPENAPPLMDYYLSLLGAHSGRGATRGSGSHLGQVTINLLDNEKRKVSTADLTRRWRLQIGPVPDAESIRFRSEIHSAGNPIEVDLSLENSRQLLQAVNSLKVELERFPGVFAVEDNFLPGKEELQIALKPAARSLGLTLNDLARQVRHAFYGAEALRLQRDRDEVKVLVRYPTSERRSLRRVEQMRIQTPDGARVPFSLVAEVTLARGYAAIRRAQRQRVVKVSADVDETVTNANQVRTALTQEVLPRLQSLYAGLRWRIEGEGREQHESLADVYRGFAMAMFGIYALLAIPFKSFSQPLIVMAAIPFGFVGALIGHLIMGFNISILSLFGMVGLAGVVVNDSLVLIYTANRIHGQGIDLRTAASEAAKVRFRAILLTSLTTFAGLTPMLLEKSVQAQFLIPMAVSLGFGVLFSTGITLLLIPSGYLILDDIRRLFSSHKPSSPSGKGPLP